MEAGTIETLEIVRKAPFGYFLSDGETDVLLHFSEANGEYEPGEKIRVFLYHDHQGRLAATCETPYLQKGECGWLEVTDIQPRMGAFLNNGIHKDLFLSIDELPSDKERWPTAGDRLAVCVALDKKDRLHAVIASEEEMKAMAVPAGKEMQRQTLQGYAYRILATGAWIMTEGKYLAFLKKDEADVPLRLGCRIEARVTQVRDDGTLSLSMVPPKEIRYSVDAEKVYDYLKKRNGKMPYTDQSDPDIIREIFGMSKGAFKRALGKLMKENKILQENDWTKLK